MPRPTWMDSGETAAVVANLDLVVTVERSSGVASARRRMPSPRTAPTQSSQRAKKQSRRPSIDPRSMPHHPASRQVSYRNVAGAKRTITGLMVRVSTNASRTSDGMPVSCISAMAFCNAL